MKVRVATIESEVYRGDASSVVTETTDGSLKIFPGHAPLLAVLRPGLLRIYCEAGKDCPHGRQDMMLISGGYLEVQPDAVTVLADCFERGESLNTEQARQAMQQAREAFRTAPPDEADKALMELELAIARLKLARRKGGGFA